METNFYKFAKPDVGEINTKLLFKLCPIVVGSKIIFLGMNRTK